MEGVSAEQEKNQSNKREELFHPDGDMGHFTWFFE
jgi:hypothetical protein